MRSGLAFTRHAAKGHSRSLSITTGAAGSSRTSTLTTPRRGHSATRRKPWWSRCTIARPPNKFPAAHEDAYGAYQWVLRTPPASTPIRRASQSSAKAPGAIAAAVCMMAREGGVQTAAASGARVSDRRDQHGHRLVSAARHRQAARCRGHEVVLHAVPKERGRLPEPSVALVTAPDPTGLPPATVINAQIDPLLSEGEAYGKLLAQAGVNVKQKTYPGVRTSSSVWARSWTKRKRPNNSPRSN